MLIVFTVFTVFAVFTIFVVFETAHFMLVVFAVFAVFDREFSIKGGSFSVWFYILCYLSYSLVSLEKLNTIFAKVFW